MLTKERKKERSGRLNVAYIILTLSPSSYNTQETFSKKEQDENVNATVKQEKIGMWRFVDCSDMC